MSNHKQYILETRNLKLIEYSKELVIHAIHAQETAKVYDGIATGKYETQSINIGDAVHDAQQLKKSAVACLTKAGDYAPALEILGNCYETGYGITESKESRRKENTAECFHKAAQCYEAGINGVAVDKEKAEKLHQNAQKAAMESKDFHEKEVKNQLNYIPEKNNQESSSYWQTLVAGAAVAGAAYAIYRKFR